MTGAATSQVRGGGPVHAAQNPAVVPIYQTAAYAFESWEAARDIFALRKAGNLYSRTGNPTQTVLEQRIAELDGGVAALGTASGQSAVAIALLSLAAPGGHVVAGSGLYGGTVDLLTDTFPDLGITATLVDQDDPEAWRAAIEPGTRALLVESIGNPTSAVPDLDAIAAIAKETGVPLVVDNTIATPALLRPKEHGADIVVYSATKQLGGHGTSLGGLIVDLGTFDFGAQPERWPQLTEPYARVGDVVLWERFGRERSAYLVLAKTRWSHDLGPALSPYNAQQILVGIETLDLRVQRQSTTAREIAAHLHAHPLVAEVHHPSVPGNPYADAAARLLPHGTGGVFSFEPAGGADAVPALVDALTQFTLAANIGDARSLVIHPSTTTHSHLTDAQLALAGFTRATIRLSIGLETPADLIADLDRALAIAHAAEPALSTIDA